MTRRERLRAIERELYEMANAEPSTIALSAANFLADAAVSVSKALEYAVSQDEVDRR